MPAAVSSSIQSFSQGWLGQFSSDPTLDGYGNAVIAGAQYYNNALNVIKIYSGTAWSNYNPGDASAAANSANLAQAYATQAGNAATSAAASAASAASSLASIGTAVTQAQNSAAAAATSATSAAGSASTAVTSATSATTSATSASGSASTASTAASSASTSATNAASSATSASTSATSASGYASNAATSATNSLNSSTASAASAASASTSATNASTSASSAASSATSAGNSATAAAASAAEAAGVVGGIISIPLTNTNVTLSTVQFSNAIIVFTGSITANIIVSVPATSHVFIAANNTTGAFTVTLGMTGGSATINVPQSKANSLFCDGSTGVYATSSVAGLQFSGTNQVTINGTVLTSTYAGTRTVLATAGMTTTLPAGSTLQSGAAVYLDNQTSSTNTIQVNGTDPIDTTSPFTMNPFDKMLMSWDGTEWRTALYSNYLSPVFKNSASVANGGFTATNTSVGIGLTITGTGGVTPGKSIASVAGSLTVLNNALSTILTLTDAGNLVTTGGIDNTIIGANTPAAATFTKVTINEPGNGTTTLVVNSPSDTNGANIALQGNGGTTPNKFLRAQSGTFQVINSAYSSTILTLTDTGTLTVPGSIAVSGLAQTISGDMTNGVLTNRLYLQTSTSNSATSVGALPSGSGTTSGFSSYNNSVPTNSGSMVHQITTAAAILGSVANGSGTLLPLTFQMGGTEEGRLSTGGRWLFNTTTDDGTSIVQINGQLHLIQAGAGGGIEFGDGTIQTTANGTTAPVSTVYTPATGTTSITTGGYTPGFIQVYQNGVRLVVGQDFTATDSVHVVLTHASGAGDTYEVLTNVIYSPQTAMTPSEVSYTPSAGTSTFTVTTYTVGFVDVYLNGSKLVSGQDFTALTGTSVTLVGFTANGTDQFVVKVWSTYTPANALPLTGGTMSGNITYSDGTVQVTAPQGRNRILNGGMNIDQRNSGAAQTITAAAAQAYTVDRWYAYCTGANVTGQQGSGSGTTLNSYVLSGAASVTAIGFGQRIETVNSFDLAGTTATLSVEMSNNLLTTVTWTAYYANTKDTFGTLASPTKTQIATGTFTVTSTRTKYSTQIAIPSAATTGIEIVFTVGAQTSGIWVISNVQLEAGVGSTSFERVNYGEMLLRCQRYFESIGDGIGGTFGAGFFLSATVPYIVLKYVTKRTAPSITTTGTFQCSNGTSNYATTAIVANGVNFSTMFLSGTVSGAVANVPCILVGTSASAAIAINAEL
jgi:hypothetical protein